MIFTFYSYKGGVGRTMALANVAELLYQQGLRVLMIDWDIEAPGLEQFFFAAEQLEEKRRKRGVVDLLLRYKQQMTHKLPLTDEDDLPFEKPGEVALDIHEDSTSGQLQLITAGRRDEAHAAEYARTVLTFDWQDFYEHWCGEAYFDWFRRECKRLADIILIDSRTGVTEIGGVCTYQLADVVALFCAPNDQNLRGTVEMAQNFARPHLIQVRGGRPLQTMVVPSRVDTSSDLPLVNEFYRKLETALAQVSEASEESRMPLEQLTIPYISPYGFGERIAVTQTKGSTYYSYELTTAYERLTQRLKGLGQDIQGIWKRKMARLTREWEDYGKRIIELTRARTVEPDKEVKARLTAEIEQVKQDRGHIEQTLEDQKREFQYYLTEPEMML